MEVLFLCACSWFVPDVGRLGADDWRTREAETRRCDNPISASLLPPRSANPEIDARIRYLKGRVPREPTQEEIERRVMRGDFNRWLAQYLVLNRSALPDAEVFVFLHAGHADAVFALWPLREGGNGGWLRGAIFPGEYDQWVEHRDFYQCRAPSPREK